MNKQIITYDAENAFLDEISLYTYISNNQAVSTAKTIVAEYFNIKGDENPYQHPPSLALVGKRKSGRRTLAFAIHNSLGHQNLCEIDGGMIDWNKFMEAVHCRDSILVRNAEYISLYNIATICDFLKCRILEIPSSINQRQHPPVYYDGLLMVAFENGTTKTIHSLIDATDATLHLSNQYSPSEIVNVLSQRANYYNWEFSDRKAIFEKINERADGDVAIAIELLLWSKRCSVANDKQKIMIKHVGEAIRMVSSNINLA
ncbi:MAG: hypothetical protein JEZ07_03380 [Phycisphaerae bacterium]|nr:hypothetical protein [Phycisphaerae bacterium]